MLWLDAFKFALEYNDRKFACMFACQKTNESAQQRVIRNESENKGAIQGTYYTSRCNPHVRLLHVLYDASLELRVYVGRCMHQVICCNCVNLCSTASVPACHEIARDCRMSEFNLGAQVKQVLLLLFMGTSRESSTGKRVLIRLSS